MEIATLLEEKEQNKIYGLYGNINLTTNNKDISVVTPHKFNTTVSTYLGSEKSVSSLKMVMLEESYLEKLGTDLSENEIKNINLASALIENKKYLVLDYFEKGLNYNELEYFKRLFKKLATNYHKTIVIFTNDIKFLWDLVDEIIYVDNNTITNIKKNEIIDNIDKLDPPQIIKFTRLMKEKGLSIDYYKDPRDLLKAIYRMKEKEENLK